MVAFEREPSGWKIPAVVLHSRRSRLLFLRPHSPPVKQLNRLGNIRLKSIFVGNLSFSTTEDELRTLFEPYGSVGRVSIMTDRDTGRSRGFGFVEMNDDNEAESAISAINGSSLGGRTLNVNEARPRPERGGFGGGGGRGGSGGGGRSGSRDDYRGHARQPREPRW